MSLRTLYLKSAPGNGDGGGLSGQRLWDALRERSEDSLLAHRVCAAAEMGGATGSGARDTLSEEFVKQLAPNLICMEGGLFADESGAWKMDWPALEDLVDRGAVLILADCGAEELNRHRRHYEYAARFLRARPHFENGAAVPLIDRTRYWKQPDQVFCRPGQMAIPEWLRPVYNGIDEILVAHPAELYGWQEALISGNRDSTEARGPNSGRKLSEDAPCVFGSVARCGMGHVVWIAGEVSADRWTVRCPANLRWLLNAAEFFARDVTCGEERIQAQLSPTFSFYFSSRSVNPQLVTRVARAMKEYGIGMGCDACRTGFSNSPASEPGNGLERATHFVLFWSRACLGAPWVERDLAATVGLAIERRIALLAVRLDLTPLPEVMRDAFRIEAAGMSPREIARSLVDAAQRIARLGPA